MATYLGRDVSKLKAKGGGKWKYLSEKDMLDVSAKFAPYRSIYLLLNLFGQSLFPLHLTPSPVVSRPSHIQARSVNALTISQEPVHVVHVAHRKRGR